MVRAMSNVYDFSKHKSALQKRTGFTADQNERAWADLGILLEGMQKNPSAPFPVTAAADEALHLLLEDDAAISDLTVSLFGDGATIIHDPTAYGTPAFASAWANTRGAFAAHGVDLPADYRDADKSDPRSAAACWLVIHKAA
ncbi:hypothetical protein FE88_08070 [Azospirillum brasilense]|nr:hypothetical protein APCd_gp03 [Azospirillum phage Cd]OPH16829.1 hypothetical protein FE89_02390 [Azospirillum brasilense]OPH21622.1 hypothetical protein FE88_08070 [Azospirillum brasilense]PWC93050.1 hypothetical protein AEJ54_14135 [Azospirillum sp. Sp 7]CAO99329.1 hypothetical protein [Azospirillum phage Cd]